MDTKGNRIGRDEKALKNWKLLLSLHCHGRPEDTVKTNINFYINNDCSSTIPGKQNVISVKTSKGCWLIFPLVHNFKQNTELKHKILISLSESTRHYTAAVYTVHSEKYY